MEDAEVVLGGPPECMDCAACCTSSSLRHAPVTGDDWTRLGDDADGMTTWIGNRVFMRMHDGRCVALEAREEGRFGCGVYARRPAVCRELERGSPACEGEIATKASERSRRLPLWSRP